MQRFVMILFLALSVHSFAQQKAPNPTDWVDTAANKLKASVPLSSTDVPTVSALPSPTPISISPPPNSNEDRNVLGGQNPPLDAEETTGVGITKEWARRSIEKMRVTPGTDGNIEFEFGASLPTIVCAILQVTDIQLQPGESVPENGIHIGDTARWSVESTVSNGVSGQPIEHLIVKPKDVGLSTNLVITTDRRTYHLMLISHKTDFMHAVSFIYHDNDGTPAPMAAQASPTPPSPLTSVSSIPTRHHIVTNDKNGPKIKVEPNIDENYRMTGNAKWKPVQVYNNGAKTYIEIPKVALANSEAPVLFIETKNGWWHHEKILVNYRVHGPWYVVDSILDKATLVAGVGANQQRVDITHIENTRNAVAKEGN
jgi:type IV secretion system protein VirB9